MTTAMFGAESWNLGDGERRKIQFTRKKGLMKIYGVTKIDRVRNEQVRP